MKEDVNKLIIIRGFLFVFSVFLLAMCYNLFFVPNELVIGGTSGLSIIFYKLFNFPPSLFVYLANVVLVIMSYFLLGKEKTKNTIIGAALYPIMITFTAPIADFLLPYFAFEDFWITALLSGLLFGFADGLVFRYGYSTGGSDIMVSIFSKYYKAPEGKSLLLINILIIVFGGFIFGLEMMVYALLVLYLSSIILDRVMFDISNSKIFYVLTSKEEEIQDLILNEFKTGYTVLNTKGGYSKNERILIMSVLPNREYFHFKNRILETDSNAFFIISDCYETMNGYKKKNIPYV